MERRKEFSLAEGSALIVRGGNAAVTVIGEEIDQPYVLYPSRSEDSPEALEIAEEEGRVLIDVAPIEEWPGRPTVRIHIPRGEREHSVETSNGTIAVESLSGKVRANASNGQIRLRDITGDIEVVCANGSIEAEDIDGTFDASTANGKITAREARLKGGSLKSGNGRISLQLRPDAAGTLSAFAGNGRVELALPQDGDFRVRIKTRSRVHNHLESYTVSTQDDTTVVEKGSGEFEILVQSFRGSVRLVNYSDFGKRWEEGAIPGFDADEMGEFFEKLSGYFDELPKRFDFSDEIPRIARKMRQVGARFGKMGEEFSRQFHEARRGEGRSDPQREVDMILEMLKEGKISTEEAERLIKAVRGH